MATTNLIVDYLVIGISSLLWVFPILIIIEGKLWFINLLSNLDSFGIGIILLGFIYVVGISISRLSDDVLNFLNERIRDKVFGVNALPSYHNMLNRIITFSDSASDYLSYRRSIIRITRACSINCLLGLIVWFITVFVKSVELPTGTEVFFVVTSCVIFFLLIRALPVILEGYFLTIKDIYRYLIAKEEKKTND